MPRTPRPHSLHYRRRGAALDRLNRSARLLAARVIAQHLHLQTRLNAMPLLRRFILASITILCLSLVVLALNLYVAHRRQQLDAEFWHSTVIQKKPRAKPLPDLYKRPERRYINEQI